MKRISLLVLLCASTALAQTPTATRAVITKAAAQFTGTCVTNAVGKAYDTGAEYCCVASAWTICNSPAGFPSSVTNSITPRFTPHQLDIRDPMTNAKTNGPLAGFQMEVTGSMASGTRTVNGFFADTRTGTASGDGDGATQILANGLYLEHWSNGTVTNGYGVEASCWNLGAGTLTTCRGLSASAQVSSGTMTNAIAVDGVVRQNPSGSPGAVTGFSAGAGTGQVTNGTSFNAVGDFSSSSGSPTTSGYKGFVSNLTIGAGNTVSDYRGLYIPSASGAGTLSASYGIYIAAQSKSAGANWGMYIDNMTGGSTNYHIYTNGTAKSSFGGNLQLRGSTSGTVDIAAPATAGTVTLTVPTTGNAAVTSQMHGSLSGYMTGTFVNTTTYYIPGTWSSPAVISTESSAYGSSPAVATVMRTLACRVGTAPGGSASYTFTLMTNGSTGSAATCTISAANTTCSGTGGTAAASANSTIDYRMVPATTPANPGWVTCTAGYSLE